MTIAIQNLQDKVSISPRLTATIKRLIRRTCRVEKCRRAHITVCLVDNRFIRMLHHKYLGQKTATDVLAFEIAAGPRGTTGDIVISAQMARSNATLFKSSLTDELCLYVVHGMLHLCGWSDKTRRQRRSMQERSTRILDYVHS